MATSARAAPMRMRVARRPRDHHRDRPDHRPASGDGRLRSHDDGRCRAAREHLRHRHRLPRHHPRRAYVGDAQRRDRLQHRPLRSGDRHGLAQRPEEGQTNRDQAAGRSLHLCRRPFDFAAGRRAAGEPRLRDGPSVVRHVDQLHQPGARPDRALDRDGQIPDRRPRACPSGWTRKSPGCTWTSWA